MIEYEDTEDDQIEWVVSDSLSSSSSKSSRRIVRHANYLEIPLKQIHFNSSTSQTMSSHSSGNMALFLNDKTLEVSICLNNMKDEISFEIKEVIEYRITRDYSSFVFRLQPEFNRSYYYHPKGYSFRDKSDKSYPKSYDPTNGKLRGISCMNFKPNYSIDQNMEEFNLVDGWIKTMIAKSKRQIDGRRMRNNDYSRPYKAGPPRDYANSNNLPRDIFPSDASNIMRKRELYITCIFPTQKRAIIYSSDGILSHFQFHIKQRFDLKWERMWYRNKAGGWSPLVHEDTWFAIKKVAISKQIPRIELYIR